MYIVICFSQALSVINHAGVCMSYYSTWEYLRLLTTQAWYTDVVRSGHWMWVYDNINIHQHVCHERIGEESVHICTYSPWTLHVSTFIVSRTSLQHAELDIPPGSQDCCSQDHKRVAAPSLVQTSYQMTLIQLSFTRMQFSSLWKSWLMNFHPSVIWSHTSHIDSPPILYRSQKQYRCRFCLKTKNTKQKQLRYYRSWWKM